MSENGKKDEDIQATTQANPVTLELWKAHAVRIRHPNYKAYQPVLGKEGLKRLFKTKTSASNYSLAVKMRYIKLLKEMENKK